MFIRRLSIQRIDSAGEAHPCPIGWIDNFAMRNFTNDTVFDDTLPADDGVLEAASPSTGCNRPWRIGSGARDT